jgi:hypothetical protein
VTEPTQSPEPEPTPANPERPRILPWHHGYRWVLFLFVAAVLGGAVYVGWRIVRAFLGWTKLIEGL